MHNDLNGNNSNSIVCEKINGVTSKLNYKLFLMLPRGARIMVAHIFFECNKKQSIESPYIENIEFVQELDLNARSVSNYLVRIKKLKIFDHILVKMGPSGWRQFVFNKEYYNMLFLNYDRIDKM